MLVEKRYFGTDGIRGQIDRDWDVDFFVRLGHAMGRVFSSTSGGPVLLGRDPRVSGCLLESALQTGLMAEGLDVELLGVVPTPLVAYLTRQRQACLGVMISASHNPYHDNGVKLFTSQGRKCSDLLEQQIEFELEKKSLGTRVDAWGQLTRCDATETYYEHCLAQAQDVSWEGRTIVVDAANGANAVLAPALLERLGAAVIRLACAPNGLNINDHCGSLHPEPLTRAVLEHQADLGIAFDGDGDRMLMVDHQGQVRDGDDLLYVLATGLQAEGKTVPGVVGTQMSNGGLKLALQERSIAFERAKIGDRYVSEMMLEKQWPLGGESSGHLILPGATSGDGLYAAVKIMDLLQRQALSLAQASAGLKKVPQVLLNVPCADPGGMIKTPILQDAINKIELQLGSQGRVLLRASGTEPVVRIMIEGEHTGIRASAQSLADTIAAL